MLCTCIYQVQKTINWRKKKRKFQKTKIKTLHKSRFVDDIKKNTLASASAT